MDGYDNVVRIPLPARSAYAIAVRLAETLGGAGAAESHGDYRTAEACLAQADALRHELSLIPARSAADRLAHMVEAKHTAHELITLLLPEIARKGLGSKARALLNLMERLDEGVIDEGAEAAPPMPAC
jgi:hypothetical protein